MRVEALHVARGDGDAHDPGRRRLPGRGFVVSVDELQTPHRGHGSLPVKERVQGIGRRLVASALEDVGGFEDQVARALIADAQLVLAAEPVEDRETDPHQRNAEPLGRLPAVAVGDQQVGALGHRLEVAEVADLHRCRRAHAREFWSGRSS